MNAFADAMKNGNALLQQGRLDDADAAFRSAASADPAKSGPYYMLAVLARARGYPKEAVKFLRDCLDREPDNIPARAMLAGALQDMGDLDGAAAAADELIARAPDAPAGYAVKAETLLAHDKAAAAIDLFEAARARGDESAPTQARLGLARARTGDIAGGMEAARAAYRRAPDERNVTTDYANVLMLQGDWHETEKVLSARVERAPKDRTARNQLASALRHLNRFADAAAAAKQVIAMDPRNAGAYITLGLIEASRGHIDGAIAAYRKAMDADPGNKLAESNRNMMMLYMSGPDPGAIAAAHIATAKRHYDPLGRDAPAFTDDRNPDRRLRVGLVSGDFRHHPVAHFVEPLLAAHDRAALDLQVYATGARRDAVTARLKSYGTGWRDIAGLNDDEAVARIRDDAVDILVDLSGGTGGNRLGIFARRAAPVQATYLGYPATTGLAAMDVRLGDAIADPPGSEAHYRETLVRLDRCFLCYRPDDGAPEPSPAPFGGNGFVTFGSFNNNMKLSDRVVALWSEILAAVPGARLLLKFVFLGSPDVQDELRRRLADAGIDKDRLILRPPADPYSKHLEGYREIDIALDTTPYNGTTTTCEALWMGVPVVSLAGESHAARVGASLLTAAGLPELIAGDKADYVRRAVDLAGDSARLRLYRATLRDRLADSPLLDAADYARRMEDALRKIWRDRCADETRP